MENQTWQHRVVLLHAAIFLVVWLGCCCVWAQPVSMYVGKVDDSEKTAKSAAWVEALWMDALGNRFRGMALATNAVPQHQTQAIQQGKEAYGKGKKAFEELNPDLAFRSFQKAQKSYESAAPYLSDLRPLCRALLYIGVSQLLNGKNAEGQASFEQALNYCPDINLTGITTEKDKLEVLNAAKTKRSSKKKGTLQINASPTAAIFIDGRFRGLSPQTISLTGGNHILSVRRNGYLRWGKKLIVVGGGQLAENASLQPTPGYAAWQKQGATASLHVRPTKKIPAAVQTLASTGQTDLILLARVQRVDAEITISAAAYNVKTKQQIGFGGALINWPAGADLVRELARRLLAGESPQINGWKPQMTPTSMRQPPPRRENGAIASGATGNNGTPNNGTPNNGAPTGGSAEPPKKSSPALAIGLGIGLGVVAIAGGVALYFLLQPQRPACEGNLGCADVTLVP